ncbi:MAG TPA: methyltransferase [Bryobacteraceae bacterium]|nr:methyltransferase [Bryobacteraceae bacterium]
MRPDPNQIVELSSAFYGSAILFTASDLGIFGALSAGAKTAPQLADELKLDGRAARILLDGCVTLSLLDKSPQGLYSNTPASAMFLVPGGPGDLSSAIRYNRDVYPAWGRLADFARSGKPVERPELHLGEDAQRTRTFVLSMHGRTLGIGRAIVPMLDLKGRRRLLDVGGGPGTWSVLIAQAHPEIHCKVLDLPPVAAIAAELIARQGMSSRVETLPGSYHDTPFPADVDVVNFFGMLHQESPENIRKLMRKAYDALQPGGLVQVLDMMTDATRTEPRFSALFAVNMALTTQNGWVFSDADLRSWMEEAGFVDFACRPVPPPMPHWLATARKPA